LKILALLLIAIAFVSSQHYECCSPPQWEGDSAGFSRRNNESFFEIISYDFANRRYRVDLYEHFHTDNRRIQKTIVEKEVQGINYQYEIYPNGTCAYRHVTHNLLQVCVPSDHTRKYEFTIGGELQAVLYFFQNREFFQELVFTAKTCLPIRGFGFHHQNNERPHLDYEIHFWNIQLGIRNPNVFNTPGNCRHDPIEEVSSDV